MGCQSSKILESDDLTCTIGKVSTPTTSLWSLLEILLRHSWGLGLCLVIIVKT